MSTFFFCNIYCFKAKNCLTPPFGIFLFFFSFQFHRLSIVANFVFVSTVPQQRATSFQSSAKVPAKVSVEHRLLHNAVILLLRDQRCCFLCVLSYRCCTEVVVQHRHRLESMFDCLPKHLLHSLQQRFSSTTTGGS